MMAKQHLIKLLRLHTILFHEWQLCENCRIFPEDHRVFLPARLQGIESQIGLFTEELYELGDAD
ncbi:MAG: hypothetical protein JWM11_3341 [Planctomycetaceae bacterium]|nr:hypothetical protein [Planctomycetaceae bacterium]